MRTSFNFRRLKSTDIKTKGGLLFVGQLKENWKLKHVKSFDTKDVDFTQGKLQVDALYQLYKRVTKVSKTGKESQIAVLVEENFRVIRFNV